MNNADLALDFLKKCQKCRENGVPNDMAILAVLHDLADYKDKEWIEKSQKAYVNTYDNSDGESYVELVIDDSPTKFRESETCKVIVIDDEHKKINEKEDNVQFVRTKMNEFIEQVAPGITHDDKLSEQTKLINEKKFEKFVKKYAEVFGNYVDKELLFFTSIILYEYILFM